VSNITDKVVVITGASSGIGESTAKLLAQQGAKVVLGARRSNRIDAVVKEISATGGKAIGLATDVTKRAEVEALIKRAIDGFGRVDVLINNAGIMPIAPIEALKVDEWDRQIDVNIKGLLYGTTFSKYPLHDDLARCCCHGARREQLGRGHQKESARVYETGDSCRLDRSRHRLRHRTARQRGD